MQVAQVVVCEGMDSIQSAPPVDTVAIDTMSTVEIISRLGPTGGQKTTTLQASSDRPGPTPDRLQARSTCLPDRKKPTKIDICL